MMLTSDDVGIRQCEHEEVESINDIAEGDRCDAGSDPGEKCSLIGGVIAKSGNQGKPHEWKVGGPGCCAFSMAASRPWEKCHQIGRALIPQFGGAVGCLRVSGGLPRFRNVFCKFVPMVFRCVPIPCRI